MSGGLLSSFVLPHDFRSPQQSPLPPPDQQPSYTPTMSSRKRKASDSDIDPSDRMSSSPSPLPVLLPHHQHQTQNHRSHQTPTRPQHTPKRSRTNNTARPLPLPRLLETLSPDDLRQLLRTLCTSNPSIAAQITGSAPRPTVSSALHVLQTYASALQASFPYGDRPSSDYAFNRVRSSLLALLDALRDYTPQFLPPVETQAATSLEFLDAATDLIHALPNFSNFAHDRHKAEAYEEISAAWAVVIREAAKKGAGIGLGAGGWQGKVLGHHERSGGRMGEAVEAVRGVVGWIGGDGGGGFGGHGGGGGGSGVDGEEEERRRVRQQLMNGTYGMGQGQGQAIQVGNRW